MMMMMMMMMCNDDDDDDDDDGGGITFRYVMACDVFCRYSINFSFYTLGGVFRHVHHQSSSSSSYPYHHHRLDPYQLSVLSAGHHQLWAGGCPLERCPCDE